MLRVTIELVPFGDESRKITLLTGNIENVAGNPDVADYVINWTMRRQRHRRRELRGFVRDKGAATLVRRALMDIEEELRRD